MGRRRAEMLLSLSLLLLLLLLPRDAAFEFNHSLLTALPTASRATSREAAKPLVD